MQLPDSENSLSVSFNDILDNVQNLNFFQPQRFGKWLCFLHQVTDKRLRLALPRGSTEYDSLLYPAT
jgi:hypothetical protein